MRHVRLLALLAGAAILGGAAWATWTSTARPEIVVLPGALDFGPLAERATQTVEVRNAGRAPLRITGISSSCGCTTATSDAAVIAPRGTARLAVAFDPVAHGPEVGPARHAVYLRTNDPRVPEVEIEVRAVVLKREAR